MSNVTFKMTVATNVGLVRSNNEDNFIVCPDLSVKNNWFVPADPNEVISLGEYGCVMVVADGMGGMNAGEVASELAVNSIKESFSSVKDFKHIADCSNHIETFLKRAIVDADAAIKKRVKEDESTSGMGTTIVVTWVVDDVAHIAWCGDSRAYLFNRNAGLSRLSNDHSYVQELVDSGKLDPELAFDHPNSNIITRSLGDSSTKARPDYMCKRLSTGDYLLLCTDGLCGLCRDEEILNVMMCEYPSLEDYRTQLFNIALEAGGYDNITIALMECMKVKEVDLASTIAPAAPKKRHKSEKIVESNTDVDNCKSDESKIVYGDLDDINNSKDLKAKIIALIVLLFVIAIAVFLYFKDRNDKQPVEIESQTEVESVISVDGDQDRESINVDSPITEEELEKSLNSTSDGLVPSNISSRLADVQKVIVRNNPDIKIVSFSQLWMDMFMGQFVKVKVVDCKYDYHKRLTEIVIEIEK